MALFIKHNSYFVCLGLDLSMTLMTPIIKPNPTDWWKTPAGFMGSLSYYQINTSGKSRQFSIIELNRTSPEIFVNFLLQYLKKGKPTPHGGITFIDYDSGETIPTNWDLGETEEWIGILDSLKKDGKKIHTFSATDAAIEIQYKKDGMVEIQNLDWEELPNRIESSREKEPIHKFKDVKFFESELDHLVVWYAKLLTFVKNKPHISEKLLRDLSVSARK